MSYQQGGGGQGAGGGQGSQGQGGMGSGETIVPGQHGAAVTDPNATYGQGGWDPNAGEYGVRTKYNQSSAWVYTGTYNSYDQALIVYKAAIAANQYIYCDITRRPGTVILSHKGVDEDKQVQDGTGKPSDPFSGLNLGTIDLSWVPAIVTGIIVCVVIYAIMKGVPQEFAQPAVA